MRLPEKAPDLRTVKLSLTHEFAGKVSALVRKANDQYMDWEGFKRLSMPGDVTLQQGWAAVKLSRSFQQKTISLVDLSGNPFTCWLPDSGYKEIAFIEQQARSSVLGDDPSLPSEEKRRYLIKSQVDEAISSSQLDGATTTRTVAKEMLRTGKRPTDRSEQMIYNNYESIQMLQEHLREPLTGHLILRIHRQMTKDALGDPSAAGRFRSRKDGPVYVFDADGKTVLHMPPDAARVPNLIEELCRFANDDAQDEFIHPVIKAILLHFWLAYVHPFMDANGRTARLLFSWYMLKHGYWFFDYLPLSTALLGTRQQYYRSFLDSETDDNDAAYFIVYNLKSIHTAIDMLHEYILKKQKEKRHTYHFAPKFAALNPRQQMLLTSAFQKPHDTYAIETHANVQGVTYQTARTDLLGLKALGLLTMKKERKKFVFSPVPNLAKKLED